MYMRVGAMCAAALLAAMPAIAQQARSAAEIVLVEGPSQGKLQSGYRLLGNVRAEIHQKSMLAKTPARELADQQLKTEAAKLGADAVVEIKYENNSPMFSKKGFIAVGKAVKFETQVASAAPVAAPAIATPPPVQTAAAAPPAAPPVVTAPAAPVQAQVVAPTPAPTVVVPAASGLTPPPPETSTPKPPVPGPRPPTPVAMVVLAEDNLSGRAVAVLGVVEAEAHQTSLFPKKTARDMLDEDLRAKAAKLGADAVISIKYDMNSPMTSKKGSRATGVAVKFQ